MRRTTRIRSATALAVAMALVALGGATSAGAAPQRTADLATYDNGDFLREALGLPAKPKYVITSVTYDRAQWLLKQPGKLAFLIGDPATDPTFAARAKDVEAAADAAGVKQVYWFNPNLSGNAKVGTITEPNLDIRNPDGITSIAPAKRTIYGYAWLNLVGQYLGNGVTVNATGQNTGSAKLTATVTTSGIPVNDYGSTAGFSTKVGDTSGGALFDYSSGSAPANVSHSYFLLYDKDHTVVDGTPRPAKILAWTDLTTQAGSSAATAAVTSAIGTVGGPDVTAIDEFSWWKSANNLWQVTSSPNEYQGATVPNLVDADGSSANGGWRVHQVTYPEYVYLLKTTTSKDLVFLLGGTWCPNTRPILPSVNKYAQQNDATVINFDTILDGSIVGGGNSGANPLQSRGAASNGGLPNAVPSFIHGDVISQYLKNQRTEYTPALSNAITYYPGGDTGQPLEKVARLQVPYLFAYRGQAGNAPHGGITRDWIYDKGDGTFTEYMSSWWWTNPQPNQLGVTPANLPREAPIWTKVNADLATFSWKTDPTTLYPNSGTDADAADYLVSADRANVTFTPATSGGTPPASVSVSATTSGGIPISPAALSSALSALGTLGGAPANNAAARAAFIAEKSAPSPDPDKVASLQTVVGAWGVSQQRKTRVANIWGSAGNPNSVAGGIKAVHEAEVFFGGLPGGVVTRRTVTADPVAADTAAKVAIEIANDYGRVPTGDVALVVKKGGTTVTSASKAVAGGKATFTLPLLAAGTYDVSLSYAGDAQIAGFTESASLKVNAVAGPAGGGGPSNPGTGTGTTTTPTQSQTLGASGTGTTKTVKRTASKLAGAVAKAPTRKARGRYRVRITAPQGGAAATGKVTITLRKGAVKKKVTGTLGNGVVTVPLPALTPGTWKVTIAWPGDAAYEPGSATGASVKVRT